MAVLPLPEAIDRFKINDERLDLFVNGDASESYTTSEDVDVPSIQKFLAVKNSEINNSTASILTGAQAAASSSNLNAAAAQDAADEAEEHRGAAAATLSAIEVIAAAGGAYRATTIAAAKAAGVAAMSVGDVFTGAADDVTYIGLYKISAGPVAEEIGRYPTAQSLETDTHPEVTSAEDTDYVFLHRADGTVRKILAERLSEDMTPSHWFDGSAEFGATPAVLIASNSSLKSLCVQNASPTATIAIALGGRIAALYAPGSITLSPGQMYTSDHVEPGAVSVISSEASTPVTCSFSRTVNSNPNSEVAWNSLLSRFASTPSEAWQTAIKTFHNTLFNRGILAKMRGFYVFAGPDSTSALLNWSAPNSATAVAAPVWTAKQGFAFNGTSQYLDTSLQLQNMDGVTLSNFGMFVKPDTTDQAPGRVAMGDAMYEIGPNITSSTFAVRGGATTSDTISGGAYGNLTGVSRTNEDNFEAYSAGAAISTVTKAVRTSWLSNNMLIGCGTSSGVAANFYSGQIRIAGMGLPLSLTQHSELNAAITTYLSDIAGL